MMKHLKTVLIIIMLISSMLVNAQMLSDTLVKPISEKSIYRIITTNSDNGCRIEPITGEWIGYKSYVMVVLTGNNSKMTFYLSHFDKDLYYIRDSSWHVVPGLLTQYIYDSSKVDLMGFGWHTTYKVKSIRRYKYN